jgi:NAD(P)-dependent dehydrogenase (short-subunit alcohol dehydrogenase family)
VGGAPGGRAGRGIAVALGAAGATVYCTGRTTRTRRSEYDRPETIEETAEMVTAAGGTGHHMAADHLDPEQVRTVVERIDTEHGRLDVLVNDIWGGETMVDWDASLWEHDLSTGLRILRLAVDTHLVTSHFALPLLLRNPGGLVVEVTDGTTEYNTDNYRDNVFYDLAKVSVDRLGFAQSRELGPRGATAVSFTPGWLRSEMMLEHFGVTEANWRDATVGPQGDADVDPGHFAISETPTYAGRAVAALAADQQATNKRAGKACHATQDGGWWERLRARSTKALLALQGTPRLMRGALVAQGAMILLLAGVLVWQEPFSPGPLYQTLSDGSDHVPQDQAHIQVVFADDITEKEIRALLTSVGGTIVKGPSSLGVYTVELPLSGSSPDLVGPVLDAVREHRNVLFAEPIPTR